MPNDDPGEPPAPPDRAKLAALIAVCLALLAGATWLVLRKPSITGEYTVPGLEAPAEWKITDTEIIRPGDRSEDPVVKMRYAWVTQDVIRWSLPKGDESLLFHVRWEKGKLELARAKKMPDGSYQREIGPALTLTPK